MNEYIKINDGEHVHLSAVKRLRTITDQERMSLAKLGKHVNAERFNTRIDYADNTKSYAPENIDQIAGQGVLLIEVENDTFIPKDNIKSVKNISNKDRQGFEQRTGRSMREDFQSRIETKAGAILSTSQSSDVMFKMGRPYQPKDSKLITENGNTNQSLDMAAQRDAVMVKATPQLNPNAQTPDQTQKQVYKPSQ